MSTTVAIDKNTFYHDDDRWGWAAAVSGRSGNAGFRSFEEAIADALRNHPDYAERIIVGRLARINDDPLKLVIVDPVLVCLDKYSEQGTQPADPELDAIRSIVATLYPLDVEARMRVAEYIAARFG